MNQPQVNTPPRPAAALVFGPGPLPALVPIVVVDFYPEREK
jgi:hypothetical protein